MGNIIESLYRLAESNSPSGEEYLLGDDIKKYIDIEVAKDPKGPSSPDEVANGPYCEVASEKVVEFLKNHGVTGADSFDAFRINPIKGHSDTDDYIVDGFGGHTVVEYNDKYYDFEFGQFIDKAPSFKDVRPVIFEKENDLYVATSPSGEKIYMEIK